MNDGLVGYFSVSVDSNKTLLHAKSRFNHSFGHMYIAISLVISFNIYFSPNSQKKKKLNKM